VKIHSDFLDFIKALNTNHVDYVIVGAFALAYLGYPRYTGDMDIWIRPSGPNARALIQALKDFGMGSLSLTEHDILSGKVIQIGYPPVRIDLLTSLDGLSAEEVWSSRQTGQFGNFTVNFIGKAAFLKNKKAIGRHKDLADVESLSDE